MSWQQGPLPLFEGSPPTYTDRDKVIVVWWVTGPHAGPLHAAHGTWYPSEWLWTTRAKHTLCSIPIGEDKVGPAKTNVSLIKDIDCPDCLAAYAAEVLAEGKLL